VAVVDTPAPQEVAFRVAALSMDGAERELAEGRASVAPDAAATLAAIPKDAVGADEMLVFRWRTGRGNWTTDHYAPLPYKAYDLPAPSLTMRVDGHAVTLSARHPSFFAAIEPDTPGRFTQNGVLVLPDTPVTLQFRPKDPGAKPTFALSDLYSATYAHPGTRGS